MGRDAEFEREGGKEDEENLKKAVDLYNAALEEAFTKFSGQIKELVEKTGKTITHGRGHLGTEIMVPFHMNIGDSAAPSAAPAPAPSAAPPAPNAWTPGVPTRVNLNITQQGDLPESVRCTVIKPRGNQRCSYVGTFLYPETGDTRRFCRRHNNMYREGKHLTVSYSTGAWD
jgi:hypothetical protein